MNDKGIENLITAIYKQAADDLMKAYCVVINTEQFLESDEYLKQLKAGSYIIQKCKKEVKEADKIVMDFVNSDKKKLKLNEHDVNKKVISMYIKENTGINVSVKNYKKDQNIGVFYLVKKNN